jgi:hypothetical protein
MRSTPGGACTIKHICPYLGATTVGIMTFSITTLSNNGLICGNWHNSIEGCYAEWRCAKSSFFIQPEKMLGESHKSIFTHAF